MDTIRSLIRSRRLAPLGLSAALLGLLAHPQTGGAAEWSLDRVLEAARHNDPRMQAVRARAEAEQRDASRTLETLSPRIHVVGNYQRTDNPAFIFTQKLVQGRFTPEDFDIETLNQPPTESAVQVGLDVTQPLWNGGSEITSPALSGHLRETAVAREKASVADRMLEAAGAYVLAVRSREAVAADSLSVAAADEIFRSARERFALDLVSEIDTLRAVTRLAEARSQLVDSRKNLDVALLHLSQIVDTTVSADRLGSLPDRAELVDPQATEEELWDTQVAEGQAGAQRVLAQRAGFSLLPSLNLKFNYDYYADPDGGASETRWSGWVLMDFPLWDGLQRLNDWKASKARAREAEAELESARKRAELRRLTARREKQAALEGIRTAELALRSSREALRRANDRYRAGLIAIYELTAADAEAARARKHYVDAEARVVLANYEWLRASGGLP